MRFLVGDFDHIDSCVVDVDGAFDAAFMDYAAHDVVDYGVGVVGTFDYYLAVTGVELYLVGGYVADGFTILNNVRES